MREVKYSILLCNQSYEELEIQIDRWLYNGIKVIWFGNKRQIDILKEKYSAFVKAYLLQVYEVKNSELKLTIVDGEFDKDNKPLFTHLIDEVKNFNSEQYLVEHCKANESLIVEAGAGTGKTTVMVDRIMFLLHTVENLSLADIAMITFTNEATQNMRHKVQQMLLKRFELTGNAKYIGYLEEEPQMRTHTIHSFSKKLVGELGASIGYSTDLKLRSYKYERKQIIRDVLDEIMEIHKGERINNALGIEVHKLVSLAEDFWSKIENLGLTEEEIRGLDWGKPKNEEAKALHEALLKIFNTVESKYNQLKLDKNAISMKDIIRELRKILESNLDIKLKSRPIQYLFVDEFQDSDNVQIKTIAWLEKELGLKLFVVGDIKQSIYRFRGANDTAFEKLREELMEQGSNKPVPFILTKNYRTSPHILEPLDKHFREWERKKLLSYGKKLDAQRKENGQLIISKIAYRGKQNKLLNNRIVSILKESLEECIHIAEETGRQKESSQRVTVLTRTNRELQKIAKLCEENQIPCYVKREGSFYRSRAVRDFLCMISAYLFNSEPTYRFNYLLSSYGVGNIDLEKVQQFAGNIQQLNAYFDELSVDLGWQEYLKAFRLQAPMAVIHSIIEGSNPVKSFVALRKKELENEHWDEESMLNNQLFIEALQYEDNLEKLLQILREHFEGDFISLYQIYSFLLLQVQTNREEDEADLSDKAGYQCIHCLTVHRSKGLEFDTVILPYTDREYRQDEMTEILIDERTNPSRVGWSYVVKNKQYEVESCVQNNHYDKCVEKEIGDVDCEEARLLYVALTRAIRKLVCLVTGESEHSWAELLKGE